MVDRSIKEIVEKIDTYTIPQFQRKFVWQQQQICELVDSILRGYSPGLLVTWVNNPNELRIATILLQSLEFLNPNRHQLEN